MARSHCDDTGIFLCSCHCHHKWDQYSFMTAMAMAKIDIMATGYGVHIVSAMAMEKIEYF